MTSDNEHNSSRAREHIRISRDYVDIDIEGTEEYVERRMNNAMQLVADSLEIIQRNLLVNQTEQEISKQLDMSNAKKPLIAEHIENREVNENLVEPEKHLNGKRESVITSLLDYFLLKSPKSQGDQVLVIASYYHHYLNQEHLSLDDYETAFKQLKKAAVEEPSNMKSTVRNVVDRTKPKLLFNPERGVFALTVQGEEYVDNIGQAITHPSKYDVLTSDTIEKGEDAPLLTDKGTSKQNNESLLTGKDSSDSNHGRNGVQKTELPDLPSFYLSLNITKQVEYPTSVLFWYEQREGVKSLNRDEMVSAFNELRQAGLKPPDDKMLKQMLDNALYNSKYIYRTDDGGFALTIQGRQHIQDLVNGSSKK
jgi:hypothetical protein